MVYLPVGLGLREQLLYDEPIPVGEHDWKLDILITPDGTLSGTSGTEA